MGGKQLQRFTWEDERRKMESEEIKEPLWSDEFPPLPGESDEEWLDRYCLSLEKKPSFLCRLIDKVSGFFKK